MKMQLGKGFYDYCSEAYSELSRTSKMELSRYATRV